jgi:hypothetical protein
VCFFDCDFVGIVEEVLVAVMTGVTETLVRCAKSLANIYIYVLYVYIYADGI